MHTILAALVLATVPVTVDAAARADYAKQGTEAVYTRYIWLPSEKADLPAHGAALAFTICSTSRDRNLDRQLPVEIAPGLYRINLSYLQWSGKAWDKALAKYPYGVPNSLIVRGDWLALQLSDGVESSAYYDLLYDKPPKSRDEFLAVWGVDRVKKAGKEFGLIEGESGVSKAGIRWIESWPADDGRAWGTRDSAKIDAASDPLQKPDGSFKHDAEEWIAPIQKQSYRHDSHGLAQAYLLSNGQGAIQQRAPVDIVEDYDRTRGLAEIRNPISCHGCHSAGLNMPTRNELRRVIRNGIEVYEYSKARQEFLERFHLSGLGKTLERPNADFATFLQACNGLKPADNLRAYRSLIQGYLAPVDAARAARDIGATTDEVRLAIADASGKKVHVGVRLADIAHGGSVPVTVYEQQYGALVAYLGEWRRGIK